jgi:hypothetical protein
MSLAVEQYESAWIIRSTDVREGLPAVESYWGGDEWIQVKAKALRFSSPDEANAIMSALPVPRFVPVTATSAMPVAYDDSHALSALLARAEALLASGRFPSAAQATSLIEAVRSARPHRDELAQRLRDLCELAEAGSLAESQFANIMNAEECQRHKLIEAMVASNPPTFEEGWLEFKSGLEGKPESLKGLTPDTIAKTWSTALSGFANTGGGLLIWGIETSKKSRDGENIDAASHLRLVSHPLSLKSRLMELHHVATDPPIAGVRVEPILTPAGDGFVVCLVPESRDKPHRAELVKNKPYYIRVGDDFVVTPHPILRAMFFPQSSPRYSVRIRCNGHGQHQNFARVEFEITITNTGTATAREPFVAVQTTPPASLISVGHNPPWRSVPVRNGSGFQGQASIHPGAIAPTIRAKFDTDGTKQTHESLKVVCLIHALDAEVRSFEARFDFNKIWRGGGGEQDAKESQSL